VLLELHGVFLAYLLLALLWNLSASATLAGTPSTWERRWIVPIQCALTIALFIDRLRPSSVPLLEHLGVAVLFPIVFLLAVIQNLAAVKARGARLTDVPILLANAALLLCTALGATEVAGVPLSTKAAALLYDHAILQHLLGSPLAHLSTLSWHVPLLVARREPQSIAGLLVRLVVAAVAGFIALMLAGMLPTSRGVLAKFDAEPRLAAVRGDLEVGVFDGLSAGATDRTFTYRPDGPPLAEVEFGTPTPRIIVEVAAPDNWSRTLPAPDAAIDALLDATETVARWKAPDILLPFPEPDGMGSLLLGVRTPEEWRAMYVRAAQRIAAIAPGTRLAVRLVGTGERSHALFEALAAEPSPVAIAGPRLVPASPETGGPAAMDGVLDTWAQWRAAVPHPPQLWILAAGCSAPAYGEEAQAEFVVGCLARASARQDVSGILFDGGYDIGDTLGLLRSDGTPRLAATRLGELLAARPAR
jgi:hypothetical protein